MVRESRSKLFGIWHVLRAFLIPFHRNSRGGLWAKALAVIFLLVMATTASAQTITGTAFKDNDGDGVRDTGELGLEGVIVTAFGATGTIASQTASCGLAAISIPANPPGIPSPINVAACPVANVGQYTVSGLAAGAPYRLEATWSDPLLFAGAQGSTSVQFADGGDTGANFGVNYPEDYCQNNPRILAGCYPLLLSPFGPPAWGPARTDDLIVSWPYDTRFASATNAQVHTGSYTKDADYGDLGNIFGVAVHRSTLQAFFSAISAPFWPSGSAGMGGIYTADYSGPGGTYVAASAGLFVDLDPLVDLTNQFPVTSGVLNRFGEQGLGGIDFSADDAVLWAVNMGAGSLLEITVGDPPVAPTASEIQEIPITNHGCVNGRFRPGPVATHRGKVFVGGVCDASTGSLADLQAKILEYDGSVFTQRMTASLGFPTNQIFPNASFNMVPWAAGDSALAPQPMMTNLAFDDDGSVVLGFMPRVMYNTFAQTAGFLVRAQVDGSGNFTLESAGASGAYTSAADTAWAGSGFTSANPPVNEGPGGGYFFENGIFSGAFAPPPFSPPNSATFHPVLFSAGLTVVPGTGEVAAGFTDPLSINAFGVRILDRDDGQTVGGLQFGGIKVALVSDVDVVCQSPPLEIGNRVWCDTNVNGVQDPDETSTTFPALDVVMRCGADAPVTKATDASGRYVFTDADYIAVNGTPIPRSDSCTLSIDTTGANGTALGSACGSTDLSPVDSGGAGPGSDLRDSDSTDVGGGLAQITINTGMNGENDHSYDFGFGAPPEDWGDAPDTYGTTTGANGPHHLLVASFQLGAAVDSEASGQPSAGADGDDTTGIPDDEDGVTFPGGMAMAAACEVTSVTVDLTNGAALANPHLDAWIDFNRDGAFSDPAEHLFGGTAMVLSAGTNVLPVTVPCTAVPGASYARFRLSDGEQLGPTGGPATAGEVEDYAYLLKADFGDAPDTYGTTLVANGPRHGVLPGFSLGSAEDAEGDGQPNATASGDDAGAPVDDEDGVSFGAGGAMAAACSTANPLDVVLTNSAGQANSLVDAWIDWNGDGDFDHPAEHLFGGTSVPLAAGSNNLTYNVPCTAVAQAVSYARVRLSSSGGLTPLGASANGEIEDYTFQVKGVDFGDAPDTYGTTLSANGPLHTIIPAFSLGSLEDGEPDGQPNAAADGDDTTGTADEDGVTFAGGMAMATACSTGNGLTVSLTRLGSGSPAQLDAWIDWNGDGDFDHPAEHLFGGTSAILGVGPNSLTYDVPCDAVAQGISYARFRMGTAGSLTPTGPTTDGEVEDYTFQIKGVDYGDAPDTYGTTLSANGPSHTTLAGFTLGALEDGEPDGQPSPGADGDDSNAQADEDGVTFPGGMAMAGACADASLDVSLVNTAGVGTPRLDAWIDFNDDGDFDHPTEHLFGGTSAALVAGTNTLGYTVPCDAVPSASYARFRLSSVGSLTPLGTGGTPAADGEVEDYAFQVKGVDFGDAPDTYGTVMASNGPAHTIVPGYALGTLEDTETDGQPNAAADGDDTSDEADEDGIIFPGGMAMAGACSTGNDLTVTLTNTAGIATALLDAWIDWNGDGDFDHPAEHLFGGTAAALSPGANALSYDVPCAATEQAVSYARFRLSSAGSLTPTDAGGSSPVADGEVEDYTFQVKGIDFGDAPDTYSTLAASDGARHTVVPGYALGVEEDSEVDGQPNAAADGDDTTGTADEDGVTFAGGMAMAGACTTGNALDVVLTNSAGIANARLDAWIDWNGDGAFDQPAEHLFGGTSADLAAGSNALTYDVPCDAVPQAVSYARFRLSSAGSLDPNTPAADNPAADGEVEDYVFQVKGVDFGDAPDGFSTTISAGGPSHTLIPGFGLGSDGDTDPDGQPTPNADGDDLDLDGDDEDGIAFALGMPMAHACQSTDLEATLVNTAGIGTAFLDGWIDFDGNGAFDHPAEHLFGGTSAPLAVGANTLAYTVPCDAAAGDSFARFRLSSSGGLTPADGGAGPVADGEVEDYAFLLKGLDWGDAPAPYATTSVDNGPWHILVPTANPTLGSNPTDGEADGQPSVAHDGDDNAGIDDEDGVSLPKMVLPGDTFDVDVTVANSGLLNAWVDFNGNGVFGDDPLEQIASDLPLSAGTTAIPGLVVPPTSPSGTVCARFRYSSQPGLGPTGGAADGEVEDYGVNILPEDAMIGVALEVIPTLIVDNGDGTFTVTSTILVENSGNIRLVDVQVEKALALALVNAVSFSVDQVLSSANLTVNGGFDGDGDIQLLSGTDILDADEIGFIDLIFTVAPGGNAGPYLCSAIATATSIAGTEVMDLSQNGNNPDPDGNGNPTDDDEPTPLVFDIFEIVEIPTLGEWGMVLMALMLLLIGTWTLRRRRA